MGISVCRNVKLANVFYRLELIEAYGTGILKIMDAYEGTGMTPQIETSDNAFKIILPNLDAKTKQEESENTGSESNTAEANDRKRAYCPGRQGKKYSLLPSKIIN